MKKNKLIVLGGFAGSGKTTIAKKLASDFNFPFFSSDDFNAGLMFVFNFRLNLKMNFNEVSPYAHELAWYILKKNLKVGISCILDMNMCKPQSWETLDELKKELTNVDVVPIILICSLERHKERIEKRGKDDKEHLNLGGDKLEDVLYKYEFINNLDRDDVIRVDANDLIDKVYKKVLSVLNLD